MEMKKEKRKLLGVGVAQFGNQCWNNSFKLLARKLTIIKSILYTLEKKKVNY